MAINNRGQVIGLSGLHDPEPADGPPVFAMLCPCHTVLWENGSVISLESLIPPQWSLTFALDINDRGEILAQAVSPYNGLVLLQPITSTDSVSQTELDTTHGEGIQKKARRPRLLKRDRQGTIVAQWE
jgi:hypothetical protein